MVLRFEFLGIRFNNISFKDAISKLETFIQKEIPHIVYTVSIELCI